MRNFEDFEDNEKDTLKKLAVEYAKTYNLYMDSNAYGTKEENASIVIFQLADEENDKVI